MTCKDCIHYDVCYWFKNYGADEYCVDCRKFKDKSRIVELPCKVGSTIYRIDMTSQPCSHEGEHYDEFYCRNCHLLLNGNCDSRKVPYIYVIRDANAQTILENAHLLGCRAFLTPEEAGEAFRKEWEK